MKSAPKPQRPIMYPIVLPEPAASHPGGPGVAAPGNTQSYVHSWLVCKARLTPEWSRQKIRFAIHANIPEEVEARVEGWVVQRWWEERTRPSPDGYYTYAPS